MSFSPFSSSRGQAQRSRTSNQTHSVRGNPQQPQYQYIETGRYTMPATPYISPYSPPTSEQRQPITTYTIRPQQSVSTTRSTDSRGIYSPPTSVSSTAISPYSSSQSRSGYSSPGMSNTAGRLSSVSPVHIPAHFRTLLGLYATHPYLSLFESRKFYSSQA